MATFTFILRACPAAARPAIAQLLGRAFSLKESTCASIADSAPIVLLPDMTSEEVAAMHLALAGFPRIGAIVEFTASAPEELPKIDWPRRPQIFKRDISDHVADYQMPVTLPDGSITTVLALLLNTVRSSGLVSGGQPTSASGMLALTSRSSQFRGIQLPEITPFGGVPTLPSEPPKRPSTASATTVPAPTWNSARPAVPLPNAANDDALSRLNELFPEDESSGFVPNNQDITSILNRLLPDEDSGSNGSSSSVLRPSGSGSRPSIGGESQAVSGWAVFLAKISDEGRRQKALPLIVEMAKITAQEAEVLSKKVIIPVLKGATQADAEAAKQRFAKIGILARIKGPE
jgi:hypothetical protein